MENTKEIMAAMNDLKVALAVHSVMLHRILELNGMSPDEIEDEVSTVSGEARKKFFPARFAPPAPDEERRNHAIRVRDAALENLRLFARNTDASDGSERERVVDELIESEQQLYAAEQPSDIVRSDDLTTVELASEMPQ